MQARQKVTLWLLAAFLAAGLGVAGWVWLRPELPGGAQDGTSKAGSAERDSGGGFHVEQRPGRGGTIKKAPADPLLDAQLAESADRLKQIASGLLGYASDHDGALPTNLLSGDGKPLLSWRVQILPHVGERALYEQLRLDEPWNSAHNSKLIDRMPWLYMPVRVKADQGETFYQAFAGSNGWLKPGAKLSVFTDGSSNTLLCAEAASPVVWTRPADLVFDGKEVPALGGIFAGRFHAATADGSVHRFRKGVAPDTLALLIDPADGRVPPADLGFDQDPDSEGQDAPARNPADAATREKARREALALEKESRDLLQKMTGVLRPVQDQASAAAASPELRQLVERVPELEKAFAAVRRQLATAEPHRLSEDEEWERLRQVQEQAKAWSKVTNTWGVEVSRVQMLPAAWDTLRKVPRFASLAAGWKQARADLRLLDRAIAAHEADHHVLPQTLEVLLIKSERGGPYLKTQDSLVDPWEQPYQYDPAGPRNVSLGGHRPDVWTITPWGQLIGSWTDDDGTATVQGTVLAAGRPLADGRILFHVGEGRVVSARVKDGQFEARQVPVGTHVAAFEYEGVPARYAKSSELRVEVRMGTNTWSFDLTPE